MYIRSRDIQTLLSLKGIGTNHTDEKLLQPSRVVERFNFCCLWRKWPYTVAPFLVHTTEVSMGFGQKKLTNVVFCRGNQVEGAFGQKSPFHMICNEISSIFLVCIVLESDLRKCSLSPLNLENGPCRERLLPPERTLRGCVILKPEFEYRLAPTSFWTIIPDIEDHCLAACKRQSRS